MDETEQNAGSQLCFPLSVALVKSPQWGTAVAEIKVPSGENTGLKRSPFQPGAGPYIAMHATVTDRDFFFANFYHSGPFNCIFFQNLTPVFPVLAVAETGSCVDPQNKTGHLAHRYWELM